MNVFLSAATLFLLGAVFGHWPYGYYQLLRWIVCTAASVMALKAHSSDAKAWVVCFVVMAILFNPIAPISLDRATWVWVDLLAAVLLLAGYRWGGSYLS